MTIQTINFDSERPAVNAWINWRIENYKSLPTESSLAQYTSTRKAFIAGFEAGMKLGAENPGSTSGNTSGSPSMGISGDVHRARMGW